MEVYLLKDRESDSSPGGVSQTHRKEITCFRKDPAIQSEDHFHPIRRQSTYWLLLDSAAEPSLESVYHIQVRLAALLAAGAEEMREVEAEEYP